MGFWFLSLGLEGSQASASRSKGSEHWRDLLYRLLSGCALRLLLRWETQGVSNVSLGRT